MLLRAPPMPMPMPRVLKSAEFWGSFKTEFVVMYERDSVLCSQPDWSWDYFINMMRVQSVPLLGAPWHPNRKFVPDCCNGVGPGGRPVNPPGHHVPSASRHSPQGVLKKPENFFLGTVYGDRPQGPPTANLQPC